ncbi:hypothetical protein BJ875DRAFT_465217 [Amylocarpus encephaloides]|uniref:Glycosyltransferase family 28 N-terminal domain-containing protein n=1 Tax=Amylocarpus encephaloides TaxID=45428 RepID=A0A9P7YFX5_9HELO|nr:hypothetical protein BJ875DRAFT_465217 [Amylocarpus encephaloides]
MTLQCVNRHHSDPMIKPWKASASDPPVMSKTTMREEPIPQDPRPQMSPTWQSERPHPTSRYSVLPARLARNNTNLSALNAAIWNAQKDDDGSSSSSSSSDDEDIPPSKKSTKKKQDAHKTQGSKKGSRGDYSKFNVGNDDFKTKGRVSKKDGRLNISVSETNNRGYLAKALGATFLSHLDPQDNLTSARRKHSQSGGDLPRPSSETTITSEIPRPKLNIVVMVIGSRGDIQPFLKLGKNLKEYGHRVRIATHPAFKDFVQKDSGLEFFSVGGDPAELMAFMVKNPGMIPKMDTLRNGEVGRRRDQMAEMFEGFWRACINATDDETNIQNRKMMEKRNPFIADAIIANPPSFAHVHCAERLGIPLHLMFTFPYTPTQAFPHPLATIKKSNVDQSYANFISYPLVEMMTWQGLGDLINAFRVKTLGLEPVSTLWAPGQLYRMKVPYTYLWSPGLISKPADWGPEIDIAGFVFLDLASSFEPPQDLVKFLKAGPPPIYIGFGSIVVDDADSFTKMIFEAVEKAGVRALVSRGWGGFGGDNNTPDNVFMLENTPHDWLFPKVSAVVHHGGAGTTAIGLKCGKPTMIVPFFGDQQFWGSMIGKAGAGAQPVPYKDLSSDKLAEGIKQCLTDKAKEEAETIAKDIEAEGDGAKNAVTSFHRSLVLRGERSMRCSILEDQVAVWTLKDTNLRLSPLAAQLLVEDKKVHWKQLRLIRHNEWNDFEGPGEPLTGGATAIMGSVTGMASGIGSVPFRLRRSAKRRSMQEKRKQKSKDTERETNGVKALVDGKENVNPAAKQNTCTEAKAKTIVEEISSESETTALGALHKATHSRVDGNKTPASGIGKHTPQGEPLSLNEDANREDREDYFDKESTSVPENNTAEDIAKDVGSGIGRTGEAVARMPMDLSLAIAQGFHNAPRLYGDTTVRRPTRITGMKSGLKAAGEEFVFGIYDGVTGVVAQPYKGARDGGPIGFVKGIGMGLTGFVLKDLAAIVGPFGYTLKGVHKELLKSQQPTHFIRRARIAQGQGDVESLSPEEKKEIATKVAHGWQVVQQVCSTMEAKRSEGLKGRVMRMKARKTWRANGAFENVEMAEKALEADRMGESLDGVFER